MCGAGILQPSQPKPFVFFIKGFEAVEESRIQAETAADPGNRSAMRIKGGKGLYQVFQGQLAVRGYEIREDGMGMAAAAYHAHHTDPRAMRFPFPEIKDIAVIISMDPAVAPASTAWAGFQLRTESCHIFPKPIF